MARRRRHAKVAFFEVRDLDGEELAPIDWPETLAFISRQPIVDRRHLLNGAEHWGQIYTYEGTDELLLARRRDEVSALNTQTGELVDTESDASSPWVEVSFIHFIKGTNRLAFVLGSNAAPRVSSLATWINLHRVFDEEVTIAPVFDKRVMEKITHAAAATLVRVTWEPDRLSQITGSSSLLDAARGVKETLGNVEVSLEVKVQRGQHRSDERLEVLREVRSIAAQTDFKKAFASLVQVDADGQEHKNDVDFINHRLTQSATIQLTDKEGNSVRVRSVFDAIYRAVERHRRDLAA